MIEKEQLIIGRYPLCLLSSSVLVTGGERGADC